MRLGARDSTLDGIAWRIPSTTPRGATILGTLSRLRIILRQSAVAPRVAVDAAVVLGLAVIVAVFSLRFAGLGFLGWDAYPILAASRPEGPGWLLDAVTRPLADGLMPASFYRPLLSLSIALEWPLWGLDAGGYLRTNAILFGLCGLALYWLIPRFGGSRGGALAAVAFFVLHPVVPDAVPYLPRRPELFCSLLVISALWLDHRGRFGPSRASIAGAWLATAAALSAKETAVASPILIAAARLLFPAPGSGGLRPAIRGFAGHAAIVAAGLLIRFRILDGVGGYPDTDLTQLPALWLRTLAKTLLGVLLPSRAEEALPLVAVAVMVAGGAALAIARRAEIGRDRLRLAAFAAVWVLTFGTVYAAAGRLAPWYLLIVGCGAAIGVGALMDLAVSTLLTGAHGRAAAVACLAGGVLLLASFAARSPLVRPLEAFHLASRDSAVFLESLEQRLRQAPAGDRVDAGRYPRLVIGSGRRQVPALVPRSLPGWARIVLPGRELAFVSPKGGVVEPPPPGVTAVVLGKGVHKRLPR